MDALKRTHWEALVQSIRELYADRLKHEPCPITSEEILTLFVKPEDHDICRRFKSLFPYNAGYYNSGTVLMPSSDKIKYANLTIAHGPYVFPVYDRSSIHNQKMDLRPDAPEELLSRYVSHLRWHLDTWEEYNLMYRVLLRFCNLCSSPAQIKFFWPSIETLAQHAQKRDEKSSLIKMLNVHSKVPVPRISQKLREACQSTSATLTVLQMLGEPPRDANSAPVQFSPSMGVTYEGTITPGEFD